MFSITSALPVTAFKTQPDTSHQLVRLLKVSCAKEQKCSLCQKVVLTPKNATSTFFLFSFFPLVGWAFQVLIAFWIEVALIFSWKNLNTFFHITLLVLLLVILTVVPSHREQQSCNHSFHIISDNAFQLPCEYRWKLDLIWDLCN